MGGKGKGNDVNFDRALYFFGDGLLYLWHRRLCHSLQRLEHCSTVQIRCLLIYQGNELVQKLSANQVPTGEELSFLLP